ncbi:AraC family transcriptional regulator [Actinomadura rupiterrae]|uniref:AraC family transcriptional regulator n=1 Tax=Actinomadura rupiterrae TaxID=559627 RepID=UPI0020A41B47|nr:AraC family transcriptional regulator [Actinomadura rupiterrae]MCP2336268.1 AraC-like DNA-binding protein [Actinomadura rupiterrae]
MDVLSDLLFRAQANDAQVRQLIHPPPWSMTYADAPSLTLVAILRGPATVRLGTGATAPLDAGDVALISREARYTISDSPDTPEQYVIHSGRKYLAGEGDVPADHAGLAARTYGADSSGASIMLRGAYDLGGDVAARLLEMLPRLAVVPTGPRTAPVLELLTREARLSEPGQDAVLRRLLDLLLVIALREWCARGDAALPPWCRALADPVIGDALHLLHERPEHPWTVGALAAELGMSRAMFAARFTATVGEPPISYLTNWRMTIAADMLRTTDTPIAAVAKTVGYQDPFAFSVAFKRHHKTTPSTCRRTPHPTPS